MQNYLEAVVELNRLLGMRFVWDGNSYVSKGLKTPIGESVVLVLSYQNIGDFYNRNIEISKLCLLVKHLQGIEKHDIKLPKVFRDQIYKIRGWEDYFGWQMEVNVAASLIEKNIAFIKSESHDFIISGRKAFIECGSAHFSESKAADVLGKIRYKIVEKSNKPYCNQMTALFLDGTNIYFTISNMRIELKDDEIKNHIKYILQEGESNFGSVVLFSYFMTQNQTFQSNYLRADGIKIDKELLVFLDEHYPCGEYRTGSGWTLGRV